MQEIERKFLIDINRFLDTLYWEQTTENITQGYLTQNEPFVSG